MALTTVRDSSLTSLRDRCAKSLDVARAIKLARIDPRYVIKNKPKPVPARRRRRR
jgi:hypothetical protein